MRTFFSFYKFLLIFENLLPITSNHFQTSIFKPKLSGQTLTSSKLRTIALLRYFKREESNAQSSLKIPPISLLFVYIIFWKAELRERYDWIYKEIWQSWINQINSTTRCALDTIQKKIWLLTKYLKLSLTLVSIYLKTWKLIFILRFLITLKSADDKNIVKFYCVSRQSSGSSSIFSGREQWVLWRKWKLSWNQGTEKVRRRL